MPFDDLVLYGISAVLLISAIVASMFMLVEVVRLFRDFVRNRDRASGGRDEADFTGGRRIVPFRDRGTVERLIAYFTRAEKR
jgi:hypothetical protein